MSAVNSIACYKRNLRTLFNVPPPRLEILSPYSDKGGGYSKSDLDMRRKAEVLQYKNASSGLNNRQTRAQTFSQVVTGNSNTTNRIKTANNECDSIPTLSTKSGVPGKPMMLYLDKSIPLYNYTFNYRDYAVMNERKIVRWKLMLDRRNEIQQSGVEYSLGIVELYGPFDMDNNKAQITTFKLKIPYLSHNSTIESVNLQIKFQNSTIAYLAPIEYDLIDNTILIRNIRLYSYNKYTYMFLLTVNTDDKSSISIDFDNVLLSV